MPRQLQAIDLTPPFIRSSDRLCRKRPELRDQIAATFAELFDHPDALGLHREPIECDWTDHLWSCRVNSSIRLFEEEPTPFRARALHVGMHDAAYRWAKHYRGGGAVETVGSLRSERIHTGALQPATTEPQKTTDSLSGGDLLQHLGAAEADEDDFSCIPVEKLYELGLSREDAERIQHASANTRLSSYIENATLVETIEELYLEYALLPLVQVAPPSDEQYENLDTHDPIFDHVSDLAASGNSAPMPVPLGSEEDVITITTPGQFVQMMEIGLERYLTTMTERQKELAHTDQRGLLVVQGSGGSGKTTVAVHRLRYLADRITMQPELQATDTRRVLYLCFNRALADVVRQMLGTLYGGQAPEHIEVYNIHQWARSYLERRGVLPDQGRADMEGFLANRLNAHAAASQRHQPDSARLSAKFIAEEIQEVIIGRGLTTAEEYLNAGREGRKSRLSQPDRQSIWSLYQEWLQFLEQNRKYEVAMLPSLALHYLRNDTAFTPYDAVIVDEAQDLTPVGLQLATQLAGRQFAHMTIFADAAQSIYRSGFRWKQAELNPRGRQLQKLTQNHRNTAQIWDMASSFLGRGEEPDEPDTYVVAERPTSMGPLPILLTCANVQTELREVVARIQTQIAEGVPPQNIGILSGTNTHLRALVQALRDEHIATDIQDASTQSRISITHPSVKLLTMHSAKGLDFPHVYVVGLTKDGIPGSPSDAASDDVQRDGLEMQRRLLYTSMIRAGQTLVMTTIAGKEHLLLADVSDELCQHERANMD